MQWTPMICLVLRVYVNISARAWGVWLLLVWLRPARRIDQYRSHGPFLKFDLALNGFRSLSFRSVLSYDWSWKGNLAYYYSRALRQSSGVSHKCQWRGSSSNSLVQQAYTGCARLFFFFFLRQYSRTPLIWTLVVRIPSYPDRLGPSGRFVEKCKKPICLEITGYRSKYTTLLWLLELQIRRGREF
jgi:hypothetical protein